MCRLFTDFDRAILSCGLFKMDTVGDAYIAAGFFPIADDIHESFCYRNGNSEINPCGHDDSTAANNVCQDILDLAGSMLAAVAQYRAETGKEVHCRIGISAGPILAGILGRLQPRFHIFGQGIRKAERKEQSGSAGAVHVSETVLRLVIGTAPPSAAESILKPYTVKSCSWIIRQVAEDDASDNEGPSEIIGGLSGLYIVPEREPLNSSGAIRYDASTVSRRLNKVAGSCADLDLNSHLLCTSTDQGSVNPSTSPQRTLQKRRSFLLFPHEDKANIKASTRNESS